MLITALLPYVHVLINDDKHTENKNYSFQKTTSDHMMNKIFLLLVFVSSAYAYVEESALTNLQTLGKNSMTMESISLVLLSLTDHWNTFRIVIPHTTDECFYLEAKLHDTIHVVYQVLKGGDSKIRAIIIDPLNNMTYFNPANEFGWYDEEAAKVEGKEHVCQKIAYTFQLMFTRYLSNMFQK